MTPQNHVRIQRGGGGGGGGGQGVWTPLENYKNIGFLSNTCPDPLKITKVVVWSNPAFNVGSSSARQRNAILTGILLAGHRPANSGVWILPPLIKLKKKCCQSWTPSVKTFWIRAWTMTYFSYERHQMMFT